jgi:hypothetical protein
MIALRYYASGSYMNVIGDTHGVSKMSVSLLTFKYAISTVIMNLNVTRAHAHTAQQSACAPRQGKHECEYTKTTRKYPREDFILTKKDKS